ncbi:amidohydrolase family protein [Pantoea eucrina]|uniref:amidohydrolase family protein n=1 Tax=Pantoea eucrina TaxID=472693 RepID=UPI002FD887C7
MRDAKQIDSLWLGADIVTLRDGRYNIITDGALAVDNGVLIWVGARSELPAFAPRQRHLFSSGIITPGLVDCHTHLLFAGDRSAEFEQRLNGASYAEIAAQGGGILATVRATRSASQEALVASARGRLAHLLAEGVTTVEIKSGYGLDQARGLSVVKSFGQGGAALAARYGALSADHLEYASEEDVRAMAEHGTVAVLLPGAFYLLRETQRPPVALFRRYGVPMALASDANPGTSPALSLRLMMNMGCTLFGMTPEEALAGVTLWGAKALGLQQTHGSLEAGKVASFVHWPLTRPGELAYWLGGELPCRVIYRGEAQ